MNERERMQEVSDWLATDEGHAWLDSQASPVSASHGLTFGPWISIKGDDAAKWWPRDPHTTRGWREHVQGYIASHPDAAAVEYDAA